MTGECLFTSESVTEGHPDKLCDQISDTLVDRFLQQDPRSLVNVECAVATGILFVAARFASEARVDVSNAAREVIRDAGYVDDGFSETSCTIMTSVRELPLADRPVDERELSEDEVERVAVGDQVTLFGYACRQSPGLVPLPIWLAHRLARRLARVRRNRTIPGLAPDGKTQVGVEFRGRRPVRIHSVTLLTALEAAAGPPDARRLERDLREAVIEPVFAEEEIGLDPGSHVFVNPAGSAAVGGPSVHAGLTGRKTAVDTYGEWSRHSGAALSGKDPTRIDRVGAYAARHAARSVVAAGLADECEVQLGYTIGLARPVSVQVATFGTGRLDDADLARRIVAEFDFRLAGIVRAFDLRRAPASHEHGFYRRLAVYGHMGRTDLAPPWESPDGADRLR